MTMKGMCTWSEGTKSAYCWHKHHQTPLHHHLTSKEFALSCNPHWQWRESDWPNNGQLFGEFFNVQPQSWSLKHRRVKNRTIADLLSGKKPDCVCGRLMELIHRSNYLEHTTAKYPHNLAGQQSKSLETLFIPDMSIRLDSGVFQVIGPVDQCHQLPTDAIWLLLPQPVC